MTLLLGTGIRVSECVGPDIDDVDFNNNGIKIRRKGGYEVVIYLVKRLDKPYLITLRKEKLIPKEGHTNALFLSLQMKRLGFVQLKTL